MWSESKQSSSEMEQKMPDIIIVYPFVVIHDFLVYLFVFSTR